jgi:hypothetical protein
MATRTVNGTSLYRDAIRRIQQLEALNATLAAQVDRMRPVVEVAVVVADFGMSTARYSDLQLVVGKYRQAMAQMAKEG